jgi:NAD(P)-dependent dehydrogenase (short-subunit alcohol dehydrogenase family)
MREEFAGKTGLIVGGSSGIEKTVGRILLEGGAEAVIIVGKNEQRLRATELELGSLGKVIASNSDIADSGRLDRLLAEIDGKFAAADLLVNSAGVFLPKPFLEHTGEDYDRYLNLNRGTFFIRHILQPSTWLVTWSSEAEAAPSSTSDRCGPSMLCRRHLPQPTRWLKRASIP